MSGRDPFAHMRGASDYVSALGRLYGLNVDELRRSMPDLADGIHTQLMGLHTAPSVSECEYVARNLEGARHHVLRLADAIRREVPHGDA